MAQMTALASLGGAQRVWAIGAAFADVDRLAHLHAELWPRLRAADRLVYLGDMIGGGPATIAAIDHLLKARTAFLARPGAEVEHIVHLRGAQEEMWQKLLQVQYSADAADVIRFVVERGVGATLAAYGGDVDDGLRAARDGVMALTRWTNRLRQAMRERPGHQALFDSLKRAAFTAPNGVLFVNAGVHAEIPVAEQRDSFWWDGDAFDRLNGPYQGFRRVVRGYDPRHGGVTHGDFTSTIDAGCGHGGGLAAACFAADGRLLDAVEM